MISLAAIVEGEVQALPVLLRRIAQWRTPQQQQVQIVSPIRVRKARFLSRNRDDEFSYFLNLTARKCGESGWIMILLDADDDCPAATASHIAQRAAALVPHRRTGVVLANREYEAWFIAAAQSLDGACNFRYQPADATADPETPRNAKGWMRQRMASGVYDEITDQPRFSARMDLEQAFSRSRSFKKLCTEWTKHTGALVSCHA